MTTTVETADGVTLTRVGDRLALVLDDALLARLGITAETRLQIRTDGRSVNIAPEQVAADPLTDEVFHAAVERVLTQYDQTFRELAK